MRCKTQTEVDAVVAAGQVVEIDRSWAGSASAVLYGSASAVLYGSASAVLYGSARAELYDSASAVLYGSASAVLYGSASAVLYGSASAVLYGFSVAFRQSAGCRITLQSPCAVIQDVRWPSAVIEWAALWGLKPVRGRLKLWKTVRPDFTAFHDARTLYAVGAQTVCTDWDSDPTRECGDGLHFAPTPAMARRFVREADYRLLQVSVKLSDCICVGGQPVYPHKLRARACRVLKEYPPDYDED